MERQMDRLLPRYVLDVHVAIEWDISPTGWLQPAQRLRPHKEPGKAVIIDLSLEGALIETDFSKHAIGDLVPVKVEGVEGRVEIVHRRQAGERSFLYGITWESPQELFHHIAQIVGQLRAP